MPDERDPYNFHYCVAVRCDLRHGNKCTDIHCHRNGTEKRAMYYTMHGKLADGDEVDA